MENWEGEVFILQRRVADERKEENVMGVVYARIYIEMYVCMCVCTRYFFILADSAKRFYFCF